MDTTFEMDGKTWYVYEAPCDCGCGRLDTWVSPRPKDKT